MCSGYIIVTQFLEPRLCRRDVAYDNATTIKAEEHSYTFFFNGYTALLLGPGLLFSSVIIFHRR
jgi:hypothetical protein